MAWLVVVITILAVVIFLSAMYFNFNNIELEQSYQQTKSPEVDLEKLSSMVAEKILAELRTTSEKELNENGLESNFMFGRISDEKTSNVIDFNTRVEGLRNVGN
ncbi:hypothetical protein SAMN05421831_10753 [Allopseudospirillum japonicum]|uniref:Uncharacterized protein n=1 Tax=Allopseudospirillum japonicum TaxID=64971 RepID=A0A1H6SU80_9GAMM|nr:hypothetical protein [Allopseudospirillum japonicum]SEI67495.1 hypothetical protein SAMN05421831_10753 [Allopseudospirillum japonicum]